MNQQLNELQTVDRDLQGTSKHAASLSPHQYVVSTRFLKSVFEPLQQLNELQTVDRDLQGTSKHAVPLSPFHYVVSGSFLEKVFEQLRLAQRAPETAEEVRSDSSQQLELVRV